MLTQIIIFLLLCLSVLSMTIRVLNISGTLYGNKPNQILELATNDNEFFKSTKFNNFTFIDNKNQSKIYYADSFCLNENDSDFYPTFFCILDLAHVPPGRYIIYSDYYKYEFFEYNGNFSIDVYKKEKHINIDSKNVVFESLVLNSKIYEKSNFQNFSLSLYGKEINSSYLESLILTKNNRLFIIPVRYIWSEFNEDFYIGNFEKINSETYKIYGVQYDGLFYNLSVHQINFIIYKKEDITNKITLLDIEGIGYYNELSSFFLFFQEEVNINLFQEFSLRNLNNLQDYHLNYIFNYTFETISSCVICIFDLKGIPIGNYTLNYLYKNENYETNIFLEIKKREKEKEKENENENDLIGNKLLNFYGNLRSNKNVEYAFFTFNGKRNINLAYIVLTDENKRKNVIQVFDCKTVDYTNEEFDLKCMIDLSYISEGKYTLSEYYINNQHYLINIGVYVN
jgi:hypothetical protein